MKITLRGVRGSIPSPLTPGEIQKKIYGAVAECIRRGLRDEAEIRAFLDAEPPTLYGYGGNTSCIQVSSAKQTVMIDAGSGIRQYGHEIKMPCEVHILMTHFHWDHLIGLNFFTPIFIPGNTIHFYAVQPEMEQALRFLFKKPYFPVDYGNLGAKLVYHRLEPRKPVQIGDLEFTPYQLDHPDPCWGYRVVHEGKAFAYCVDTECMRTSAADLGPDLLLYQGIDVMVFDGQYTLAEAAARVSWGHAAASIGLDIAMRENIKNVFFTHHDPNASDAKIHEAERQTRAYYISHLEAERKASRPVHEVQWSFAREGLTIDTEML